MGEVKYGNGRGQQVKTLVRQQVLPSTSGRGNERQGLRVAGVTSGRGYEWQG